MDLGIFKRSRYLFWSWIVAPLALTVGVYVGVHVFSVTTREALTRRQTFLKLIPEMDLKMTESRKMLRTFTIDAENAMGPMEALNATLQSRAQEAGFTINSLAIDENTLATDTHPDVIKVRKLVISGEGSLPAIMKFLHIIKVEQHLLAMDNLQLRAIHTAPRPYYHGEFSMHFHEIKI
jgi:hypothetical protein